MKTLAPDELKNRILKKPLPYDEWYRSEWAVLVRDTSESGIESNHYNWELSKEQFNTSIDLCRSKIGEYSLMSMNRDEAIELHAQLEKLLFNKY